MGADAPAAASLGILASPRSSIYARFDRSSPFGGGGDAKRLQWLNHHVTSHWPSAQVTTVPAPDAESLTRFVEERSPDAVILQIDFGNEAQAATGLSHLTQMLRAQPNTYCIILANTAVSYRRSERSNVGPRTTSRWRESAATPC